MSMEAIRNNRGAVSIFLILVLVPCIAISCIFVDLSRVELSKSSAEASADLALNTLLTNYDADLSEYYGLIGSCQNIEDFYTVSAEYFLRTISSQGLSNDEIHLLAGVYANATSDDTIYDLLQVECVSADKTKLVSEVPNANLGNPAMLKDSVVEFMKYRAPIEIATSLIARLQASSSEVKQLQEADENDKLKKQKEEFYQAEGELMKAAVYSYKAIEAYVNEAGWIDQTTMQQDAAKIDSYRAAYQEIHKYAVNYLLNTGGLTKNYKRVVYNIDNYNNAQIKDLSGVYSSTGKAEDGTTIYYLNGNKLDSQIEAATKAISELTTAASQYNLATQDLMNKWHPATNGYNPVQWWVDMDNAVYRGPYGNVHSAVNTKGKAVMNAYKNIKAMMEGCEKEPKPENADKNYKELPPDEEWKQTCLNKLNELEACYKKYLAATPTNWDEPYIKAAVALATISTEHATTVTTAEHTVTVDGQSMTVDSAVIYIAGQLGALYTKYEDIIAKLDTAIDGDGEKVKSLDDLLTLAETYGKEFGEYNSAAQSSETDMGKDEQKVIEEMTLQKEITRESVTELKTRLENIRDQFSTLRTKVQAVTYGGTALKDITSFATFKNAALTVVKDADIPQGQTALDNYVGTTFKQLYKPDEGSEIKLEHTNDDNYHPDLLVNTPELYAYMQKQFQGVNLADVEKEAENEENVKNKQNEANEAAKTKATTYRGKADAKMPANFATEGVFGVTDMLTSIIDLVSDLVKVADGGATRIRDDLFVTTYAMEMFSYATFDREAMYRNMSEDARKQMVPGNVYNGDGLQYYKDNNVYGDPAGNLREQEKMWVSTNEKDTFNKSLTNKMIDVNNNHVYLAEVEYLLYGQADPVENLKKSYGDIYTIRLTLNAVSAFHHFWGTSNDTGFFLENVAIAISSFTGYVVPAKVIKAVLLPILAAAESCKDNQRLFAGMPVELYKMEENDWWYSLEGKGDGNGLGYSALYDLLSGDAGDKGKNKDQGLFYSDYMTLFVYCGFTHNETAMYRRLGSLIEANMHTVLSNKSGKSENYSLTKTRMYFSLKADLRVKPLMVTIPYYLDEYDTKGMRTATDWCSYDIDIVRGYS